MSVTIEYKYFRWFGPIVECLCDVNPYYYDPVCIWYSYVVLPQPK